MAGFEEVSRIIHSIAYGIEEECSRCLDVHKDIVVDCIQEQLYSGQDGTGRLLNPTYDNDPYFNEDGPWKNKAEKYKHWKESITPPIQSEMLFLPPRPVEVPNLFITGTFYDSIHVDKKGNGLRVSSSGFKEGPDIERKYGEEILAMGDTAKEYFNIMYLRPWINRFFRNCGYK